ncbi:helix-turn-helix domain-containing protein [Rhodococcus hoagii]|nr:helix-turn-helix domain-containing protein [Prescottella equi]
MKIEAIVGERVRDMRERRGLSQPELGRRLKPLLGVAWPKQTVSSAEKGKRSFTASDLVALAHVLQVPVGYLLKAPMGVDSVELGSGASIPAESLHEATLPSDVNREALHDLGRAIAQAASEVEAAHTQLLATLGTAAILYDEVS